MLSGAKEEESHDDSSINRQQDSEGDEITVQDKHPDLTANAFWRK